MIMETTTHIENNKILTFLPTNFKHETNEGRNEYHQTFSIDGDIFTITWNDGQYSLVGIGHIGFDNDPDPDEFIFNYITTHMMNETLYTLI